MTLLPRGRDTFARRFWNGTELTADLMVAGVTGLCLLYGYWRWTATD